MFNTADAVKLLDLLLTQVDAQVTDLDTIDRVGHGTAEKNKLLRDYRLLHRQVKMAQTTCKFLADMQAPGEPKP